jgi:signal transduction histidine kinase/CheY-like chemotaxis protein/HPt (histidine-containing phosphotransfer) domain-containing protein
VLPDGRYEGVIVIPPEYRDCPAFFHLCAGIFSALPRAIGLLDARVDLRLAPRQGTFVITPPATVSWWHRVRWAFKAMFQAGELVDQLAAQNERLTISSREALAARADAEAARNRAEAALEVAEAQRAQAEAARAQALDALRLKSEFVGTISHELRTPMNGILGLLELHQRTALTPEQREQVRVIRDSATTLLAVLDDTLDFSRLEAGQIEIEHEPLGLRDLAEGALRALAPVAAEKGVRLLMFVDPALPATVRGDAVRLRQVLFNLCNNALKFTAKGHVVLRVEAAGAARSGQIVRFQVEDTGIGIAPDVQERLFKPFQQAEASLTRRFGGSGLGLAICKALIDRMGGEIGFTSTVGAGSTFWFDVALPPDSGPPAWPVELLQGMQVSLLLEDPLERAFLQRYLESAGVLFDKDREAAGAHYIVEDDARGAELRVVDARDPGSPARTLDRPVCALTLLRAIAAMAGRGALLPESTPPAARAQPAPPADPAEAERSGRLILVVEDHSTNRRVIGAQLNALGYAADLASDGREALAMAGQRAYALVLSDLHMPEMDGLQLTRELRTRGLRGRGTGGHLPILALTANTLRSTVDRCHAAGMDDVLVKPVSLNQLAERLARWLPEAAAPAPAPAPAPVAAPAAAVEPAAGTGTAPIDTAVLREILGGDDSAANGLLKDFVRINTPLMQQLDAACRDRALPKVQSLAHKVLGSAHFAGARPLAELLTSLENAARDGEPDGIGDLGERAHRAFAEVRDWVAARAP